MISENLRPSLLNLRRSDRIAGIFIILATAFALVAMSIGAAQPNVTTNADGRPNWDGKRYIVAYKDSVGDRAAMANRVRQNGGKVRKSFRRFRGVAAELTAGQANALGADPDVDYVEPDYYLHPTDVTPNDPQFGDQWALVNEGQSGGTIGADIDAPGAWNITTGSSDVIVAVIDSGADYTHPDLAANMWVNTAEVNGTPGVDDDGNGFVDDVHGYDFFHQDGDPWDDTSHGTHVSGIIGAVGNNQIGVSGVSWNVRIMALKFLAKELGNSGYTSDAVLALEYAVANGAQVVNASWGGGGYSLTLADVLETSGILFIASAGNDGVDNDVTAHYPSGYEFNNVISVASSDDDDLLASYSNFGAQSVDLAAPGSSIQSTLPGGWYGFKSGTSMAAPQVAGVAALIYSVNPSLSAPAVAQIILDSVDPIPALNGLMVSGGRLNAFNALSASSSSSGGISDGFESGDLAGGSGWLGNWSQSGDASVITGSSPNSGAHHLRLRRANGYASRTVDLSQTTGATLSFASKVESFESSDTATVSLDTASGLVELITFTAADSDNTYYTYEIDLAGLDLSAPVDLIFDANMRQTTDQWYIDDVSIQVPGEGGAISILEPNGDEVYSLLNTVTLTGAAQDDEGNDISSGIVWSSNVDGVLGSGATLNVALTEARHTISASVTDGHGGNHTALTRVLVFNQAPVIDITDPLDGTRVTPGDSVNLAATVTDVDDPDVGGLQGQIEWFVRNHTIGIDVPVSQVAELGVDLHTFTATVTDDGGKAGFSESSIFVSDPFSTSTEAFGPFDDQGVRLPADSGYGGLTVTDFNQDGFPDLAVMNAGELFDEIYLNDGTGAFPTDENYKVIFSRDASGSPVPNDGYVVAFADLTGNGHEDAIIGNRYQSHIMENTGSEFVRGQDFGSSEDMRIYGIATGDLNGDGWTDFVVANALNFSLLNSDVIYLNQGNGNFGAGTEFNIDESTSRAVDLGDIDNDGDLDIAIGNALGNSVSYVYLNDGNGGFSNSNRVLISSNSGSVMYRALKLVDMNNDGWLDVLIGRHLRQDYVVLNDGTGQFTTEIPFGLPDSFTYGLGVGDLNDDGFQDVAQVTTWTSSRQGSQTQEVLFLNDGSGRLLFGATIGGYTTRSRGVAIADMDQDGRNDIVIAVDHSSDGLHDNLVYFNQGGTPVNLAPVVSILSPANGAEYLVGETVSLSGNANDPEDGDLSNALSWASDLDGSLGSGSSLAVSTLSEGTHLVTAQVEDSGGQVGLATVSITVSVPNTDPMIAISSPANGSSFLEGTSVTLVGAANDAEDGDISGSIGWSSSLDGGLGSGSSVTSSTLSVGTHVIIASITDAGGATDSASISVTVTPLPNTAPTIAINSPANGTTVVEGDNVVFIGSASDPEEGDISSNINWASDLDGSIAVGGNVSVSWLSVGIHQITASVTDAGGLSAATAISITVNPAPNTAPTVSITSPTDGSSFTEGTLIQFTASAGDAQDGDLSTTVNWSSDLDGSIGIGGSVGSTALSVGAHTITATVTDSGGLAAADSVSVTINVVPPGPVILASDGFESGNFSGGAGWNGAWAETGDSSVLVNVDSPHEGSAHVRLRRGSGYLERSLDLSGATQVKLSCWVRVDSFEGTDSAAVKVSSDGNSYTTLQTFSQSDSGDPYQYYEWDLSGMNMSGDFRIVFDANMNKANDRWFIDSVEISGVPTQ